MFRGSEINGFYGTQVVIGVVVLIRNSSNFEY